LYGRIVGKRLRPAGKLRRDFRWKCLGSRTIVYGRTGKSRGHLTASKMGCRVHRRRRTLSVFPSHDFSKHSNQEERKAIIIWVRSLLARGIPDFFVEVPFVYRREDDFEHF